MKQYLTWGYSSVVEHSTADREVPGSNPGAPSAFFPPFLQKSSTIFVVWFVYWGCCRKPHMICSSVCPNLVPRSLLPYCFSYIVYDHKLDNSEGLGTRQNGIPCQSLFGVHDHPLFTYGDGAFCLYYVTREVHI